MDEFADLEYLVELLEAMDKYQPLEKRNTGSEAGVNSYFTAVRLSSSVAAVRCGSQLR
jgi:hypothetical protein